MNKILTASLSLICVFIAQTFAFAENSRTSTEWNKSQNSETNNPSSAQDNSAKRDEREKRRHEAEERIRLNRSQNNEASKTKNPSFSHENSANRDEERRHQNRRELEENAQKHQDDYISSNHRTSRSKPFVRHSSPANNEPVPYQGNIPSYQGNHNEIKVTDGNAKIIQSDGTFIVNGETLGKGRWYSETRFGVLVPQWGNIWWVGDLSQGGAKTITVNNESEIMAANPQHFEQNY